MKAFKLAAITAGLFQLISFSAFAENVDTTDGIKTVIESVAPLGSPLSYVSGGDGLTGLGGSYPIADSPAEAMNNYDHKWLQFGPSILMTSGDHYYSSIFAIAGTDHGPFPYENLEFIIWGSNANGTAVEEGHISKIYRDGFDTADTFDGHSDDYTSLWTFTGRYNYFLITAGNHLTGFSQDTEGEIDALAAPVPEPETYAMLLAGLGLMGLVARRRKSA